MRTMIQGGTIIAYADGEHRILPQGVVVYEDDRICFIGQNYSEPVDHRIDARDQLIIPGLINLHCHASTESGGRLIADVGRQDFFQTGYLNYYAAPPGKRSLGVRERASLGGRFALLEMLRGGCTTIVEHGAGTDELVAIAGSLGIRAYLGAGIMSGTHGLTAQGALEYRWREDQGLSLLERAQQFIETHHGTYSDRIRGMLFPMQVDTSQEILLQETLKVADALGVGIQIHTGQNLVEFHEILRRHRRTPLEWLDSLGFLRPGTILSHCIITANHRSAATAQARDLDILAASGASVAHCPLVFARRGMALDSLPRYLELGIPLGLGTDTYPRDLIQEMRLASLLGKVMTQDFSLATARDVFNAATLGGAQALGRSDLGRLTPGAKADIVILHMRSFRMGPYRDPIKAIVNCGTQDDVRQVIVDGQWVVKDGSLPGLDEQSFLEEIQKEAEALWSSVPEWHWQGVSTDEFSPASFTPLKRDLMSTDQPN